MNLIDVFVGIILLLGFYSGFKKGLVVELTSFLGLVLGVVGAFYISKHHGLYIGQWLDWENEYLKITTFLVSFILIVVVVSLIGKAITGLMDMVALGMVNKILGGAFGLLKIALLISVLLLLFNIINAEINLVSKKTLEDSISYPILNGFSQNLWSRLVEITQEHKSTIEQLPNIAE